ncbi:MAG: hypothetical protein M0Z95_14500 [Actinomycetota bacterium]|nr:hypothetical protein [Actinomycetota bacterium]
MSTTELVGGAGELVGDVGERGGAGGADRWRRAWAAANRPWLVAVVAMAVGTAYVLGRLVVAAHGNIAAFVIAGRMYADPARVPSGLPVRAGTGYDGEFYYRMALDPFDFARRAFGIRMDSRSRFERIGYPFLSWLAAGGHASAVPDAMVAVNLVALGGVGLAGGLLATDSGRHAWWGLVFPGYWGFLWSLGRDLTEITAAAFLLLGLWAYRRKRHLAAGLLLLGAVLSKETAVLPVAVLGIVSMVRPSGRTGVRRLLDPAWVVPAIGFCAWQVVVLAETGALPLLRSGNQNLGIPFAGLARALDHYAHLLPSTASLLWWSELAILAAITVAVAWSWRASGAPLHERLAWVVAVALAVSVAVGIWLGDVGFRSLDTMFLFGWLVLLGTTRKLWLPGGVCALMWLVVAVELVRFI